MPRKVTLSEAQYPNVLNTMMRAEMAALAPQPMSMNPLYNTVRADSGIAAYPWASWVDGPEEWTGTRTYGRIREALGQLRNKDWSNGILVERKEVRRRGIGYIRPSIAMMAMRQQTWKDQLAVELLPMLTATNALDGHPFFSSDASLRGFSNIIAGTGVGAANLAADLRKARIAGRRFKWMDHKLPMGVGFNTVVIPPELEDDFILLAESAAAIQDNKSAGVVNTARKYIGNLIVNELLEDPNDWYYFNTALPIKPLIYQWEPMENGREVMPETDMTKYVSDGHIGYAVSSAGIVGPGFPFLGIKVTNA